MLNEYAVDPRLLTNLKDCRYFLDKFGESHGRFISKFPKKWAAMVYEGLANCGDMERKRIEELLAHAPLLSRQAKYDSAQDWLVNAETEDTVLRFHGIISRDNPRASKRVVVGDEIDGTHSIWNCPCSAKVKRVAQEIVGTVKPLLLWCTECFVSSKV